MTVTADLKRPEAILRDLLSACVTRPEALRIESQASGDGKAVYWAVQGAPEDESRLIGKGGTHVRSIERLVAAFGAARGEDWTFRLITNGRPSARPTEHPDAISHDPEPNRLLLDRVLAAVGLSIWKTCVGTGDGPRTSLTFVFSIRVSTRADASTLLAEDPEAPEPKNLVAAVGTLFRAIAKKSGVRYGVEVAK